MAAKILLRSTVLAAGAIIATEALAHAPAPLIPTALVEDVKGTGVDVEFMDYVGAGQVIKLRPSDVLVLSYLKSCQHEAITGGTVTVGTDHSEVDGGKVVRTKVACDGGKVELSSRQATETAATAFRLQSAAHETTLYARSAMIEIPRLNPGESHELVIERIDRPGERLEIKIDERLASGGFYDMAKTGKGLAPGATRHRWLADLRC